MPRLLVLCAFIAVAAGCGSTEGPPVVAANPVVTAPGAGMPMAAGYLEISNRSGTTIRIDRISSPEYGSVEMHETVIEDGIARMREIPVLEIEDGGTAVLERAGKHLMLIQPVGNPETVTLNFYSGEVLILSVTTEFAPSFE